MKCPNCGHELSESAERCTACNAELVRDEAVEPADEPMPDLVTVLESKDPTLWPVVKALLEAEGIECCVENEHMQDLIGLGRFGTGFNPIVGPVYLQVAPEDEAAARELIEHHIASLETESESAN